MTLASRCVWAVVVCLLGALVGWSVSLIGVAMLGGMFIMVAREGPIGIGVGALLGGGLLMSAWSSIQSWRQALGDARDCMPDGASSARLGCWSGVLLGQLTLLGIVADRIISDLLG